MGIAVPIEESGRQHHQKPTMKAFVASSVMALAATTGASPAADPALIYSGLGGVVAPVIGTVDTGLKFHPESGAVTPDFTEAQRRLPLSWPPTRRTSSTWPTPDTSSSLLSPPLSTPDTTCTESVRLRPRLTPLWSTPLDTPLSLMLWPQLSTPTVASWPTPMAL